MKRYFRVSYDGYLEGEYDSPEKARLDLIYMIENGELDAYGRDWTAQITVEEFDEETKEWK